MDSIFIYHASATAFGGFISKPVPELIPAQGMVNLPIVGGYAQSRTDNYRFRELVSFRAAHAMTSGGPGAKDGAFNTLVTTTLEDVNIMDIVYASRITCRIASEHPRGVEEPSIIPLGSDIEGLRVGGHSIDLRSCAGDFSTDEANTYSGLPKAYGRNGNLQNAFTPLSQNSNAKDFNTLASRRGYFLASLFCPLKNEYPGLKISGNCIQIPHFGRVYLGEIRISRDSRRVTMLRVELGCSFDGFMSMACGIGNGHEEP